MFNERIKNIKVKYNNELINIKNFNNYIDLYIGNKDIMNPGVQKPHREP